MRLRDMGGSKRAASMARRRGEEERGRRSAGARKKKPVPRGPEGLVGWLGRVGRERVAWAGRQAKAGEGGKEVAGWAEEACRAARSAGPKAKKGKKKEFPN